MPRRSDLSSVAPSRGAPIAPSGGERGNQRPNREARNNSNIAQLLDIEGPSDIGKFTTFLKNLCERNEIFSQKFPPEISFKMFC